MPAHIRAFIEGFENQLSEQEFNSPKFAYRVLFIAKNANRKGQADQVIEFVKADSPLAENINKAYTIVKETERPKHLPNGIVQLMRADGYARFSITAHTNLWKGLDAKSPGKGFGVQVQRTWYWYDTWVDQVRKHCQEHAGQYR
jgi:hypothetical protein